MERIFDTPNALTAELRIPAGQITINTAPTTTTTVRIEGARSDDDYRIRCDRAPSGHRLIVEFVGRKAWGLFSHGHDVRVDITCPEGPSIDTNTGSADMRIDGHVRGLTFRTGSGDLRFDDASDDVSVKTASGDVIGGIVDGHLTFMGASGDLLVAGVRGGITARAVSGDIRVDALGGGGELSAVSGNVTVASARDGRLRTRAVSGDVAIGIPEGTGAYLDLSSASGDVRCDLDEESGPVDDSDLELAVTTVSGDIRVRRATALSGQDFGDADHGARSVS